MGRCRGLLLTVALATVTTIAIAWPVVTNPRELAYGHEIDGRHHDAYTVMQQIAGSGAAEPYAQPLTDRFGWLLARVLNPVAAYNLLVLLSFPLTAATTYALARHLTASHEAALVAAFVFTFAPVRLAHAAYHPHIVQTQWLPLYLLALVALIERASWPRVLGAALACGAFVLSNFYNGLIGALVTPVMLVAYWAARRTDYGWRSLAIALAIVTALAAAGLTLVAVRYPQVVASPSPFAFAVSDVARYSAHWWAYFVPSVDHPLAGDWAAGLLARGAEAQSIVEQQIYLGYAGTRPRSDRYGDRRCALAERAAVAADRLDRRGWHRCSAGVARPLLPLLRDGLLGARVPRLSGRADVSVLCALCNRRQSGGRNCCRSGSRHPRAAFTHRLRCGREPARHRRRRILAVSLAGARRASDGRAPLAGQAAGAGANLRLFAGGWEPRGGAMADESAGDLRRQSHRLRRPADW